MSSPGHPIEVLARLPRVCGLSQHRLVEHDIGIAGDDQRFRGGNDLSLAASVLDNELGRIAIGQLLDARNRYLELDPELLEDLPPLGRARR
jgi:hypothetical protein